MKYCLIIVALFAVEASFAQSSKEDAFAKTVADVIVKLSKRDSAGISRLTDKATGVYILNTIGIMRTYEHVTFIGFSSDTYPQAPFYDKVKVSPLKYATLPTFNCEKWTKTGLFVDTNKVDHMLSRITIVLNKDYQKNIPAKKIAAFRAFEAISRRVVVAVNNGNELIFYLSYINDKWVLTIIDKATCDCSV